MGDLALSADLEPGFDPPELGEGDARGDRGDDERMAGGPIDQTTHYHIAGSGALPREGEPRPVGGDLVPELGIGDGGFGRGEDRQLGLGLETDVRVVDTRHRDAEPPVVGRRGRGEAVETVLGLGTPPPQRGKLGDEEIGFEAATGLLREAGQPLGERVVVDLAGGDRGGQHQVG